MCNLYFPLTKGQAAIPPPVSRAQRSHGEPSAVPGISLTRWRRSRAGRDGERELVMARWGMSARPNMAARLPLTFAM